MVEKTEWDTDGRRGESPGLGDRRLGNYRRHQGSASFSLSREIAPSSPAPILGPPPLCPTSWLNFGSGGSEAWGPACLPGLASERTVPSPSPGADTALGYSKAGGIAGAELSLTAERVRRPLRQHRSLSQTQHWGCVGTD